MTVKNLSTSLLIAALSIGCSQDNFTPVDDDPLGFSYYPLEEDMYWIYQVREGQYQIDGSVEEESYQLRFAIMEQEETADGMMHTIQVQKRKESADEWLNEGLYQSWKNSNIAVLNTGSASYVKLSFPVENERSWDGNSLNSQEQDLYVIDSTLTTFSYLDNVYFNTATVIQEFHIDPVQITSDNVALEVYSKGVGMVYKELRNVSYKSCSSLYPECCGTNNTETCFGEINEGSFYTQWLLENGIE